MFPYSKHEPVVDDVELQRLDALADSVEIKRLTDMKVLTASASMPADCTMLATRFVRTRREKPTSQASKSGFDVMVCGQGV